jgi:chromosome segregation ATPase
VSFYITGHHDLKSLLQSQSAFFAERALLLQKAAQEQEVKDARNLELVALLEKNECIIRDLEKKNCSLQHTTEHYAREIRSMESELVSYRQNADESELLRSELIALRSTIDSQNVSIEEKDNTIRELIENRQVLQHQISELEDEFDRDQNIKSELNGRLLALEREICMLKEENSNFKAAKEVIRKALGATVDPPGEVNIWSTSGTTAMSTPGTLATLTPGSRVDKKKKRKQTEELQASV